MRDGEENGESPKGGAAGQRHRRRKSKSRDRFVNALIYFVLAAFSLICILPLIGIIIQSSRCTGGTDCTAGMISSHWGWDNYVRLFRETMFLRWYGNTFLVGLVTAIAQTAIQLAVGYVFSRFRFRGRKLLMGLLVVLSMVPAGFSRIAVNGLLHSWDLTGANAPYGAIVVYAANAGLGFSIAKGYFDSIDRSVGESAQMDGATQLQIFVKIFLPTAKPIIVYTLLTGFMLPWSDFSFVDAILPGYMVADGLQWILTSPIKDSFSTFCAGSVVVSVPIVILFLLLQKYYILGESIRTQGKHWQRNE